MATLLRHLLVSGREDCMLETCMDDRTFKYINCFLDINCSGYVQVYLDFINENLACSKSCTMLPEQPLFTNLDLLCME